MLKVMFCVSLRNKSFKFSKLNTKYKCLPNYFEDWTCVNSKMNTFILLIEFVYSLYQMVLLKF